MNRPLTDPERGKRLRLARVEADLQQSEVGPRIGSHPNQISAWERGDNISEDKLLDLAALYGQDPAWLRYGAGQMVLGRSGAGSMEATADTRSPKLSVSRTAPREESALVRGAREILEKKKAEPAKRRKAK